LCPDHTSPHKVLITSEERNFSKSDDARKSGFSPAPSILVMARSARPVENIEALPDDN
jgi:hypothetical protein